jgi:CRISPR-associated protein Cmr4
LPIIQASSLKGVLRAETSLLLKRRNDPEADEKVKVLFGPETQHASEHAGCVSPHDARMLLFPIRSLLGVLAWATCPFVLERFKRELTAAGFSIGWQVPNLPTESQKAFVGPDSRIVADGKVVLEEFCFEAIRDDPSVKHLVEWLKAQALPQSAEYEPFRKWLPERFVLLPDDAFRDFTLLATEVIARIRLDQKKKTVAEGALWSEEHLPSETLLYAPIFLGKPVAQKNSIPDDLKENGEPSAAAVLRFLKELCEPGDQTARLDRLQIGGDETIGRGIVKVRWNAPTS